MTAQKKPLGTPPDRSPRGLEPAATIISKLGGTYAVARICGAFPARVSSWKQPSTSPHHGGGGKIPKVYWGVLLNHAIRNGIELSELDFVHSK